MRKIQKIALRAAAAALALGVLSGGALAEGGRTLVPVGRAVGIELQCDGVLVAGLSDVPTAAGAVRPGGDAGILPGDIVVGLNDAEIRTAEDFLAAAENFGAGAVTVLLRRGEKLIRYTVTPAQSTEGGWKLGLLLRDGISGIGTVTFYDPDTGLYGALGHAISDTDTGVLLPAGSGTIASASVTDVRRGAPGAPGELHGVFDTASPLGCILRNTPCGIFGTSETGWSGTPVETASADQIRSGAAVILAQAAGSEPREYAVEVARVSRGGQERLTITVTDPALLALTGGIVQGMSGCPILQDGRLIGAVTHVLLSDPTRGYGVPIGDMLSAADGCVQSKDAA